MISQSACVHSTDYYAKVDGIEMRWESADIHIVLEFHREEVLN